MIDMHLLFRGYPLAQIGLPLLVMESKDNPGVGILDGVILVPLAALVVLS